MNGEERRKGILERIRVCGAPVSGTDLANEFGVSRQVVVQDIALLRAADYDIISTNRGYWLQGGSRVERAFCVCHRDDQIEEELDLIVDFGGVARDVFVRHEVYGEIRAELNVSSRLQAAQFAEGIRSGVSRPLKNITSGVHFHTVEGESEEILNRIGKALKERGFLV